MTVLRLCLLHLGAFPRDYSVEKDTLIWRWVAEGFVHRGEIDAVFVLYEIGESYLNELVNRSMIQTSIQGTCRVHPMMFNLIRYFASQENFVTIMGRDPRRTALIVCV